ncbi:MAG: PepSY domain-containing protein [Xanthomonadaceae bacterium]|nr:PepSY domain-containing protein [Xanthomonadaceae bacterium]
MKMKTATLSFALALGMLPLGVAGVAMAQQAMTGPQVHGRLTEQGYTRVHDLRFKDGMWRAKAKSADGERVTIRIDARTGQIYPDRQVSRLDKDDVRAALESQGYTEIHDVEFEDGLWKAKAENPAGNDVKLKIDANTGKVVGIE